jgi:flagellar hook protein FlgE
MSLFGALNTAISGLTSQSDSFGNISEDIANSQTTGFKRVDTTFIDYLTTSTPIENQPGSVVAQPEYENSVQGTITQVQNPLGLAISGQGFFAVSENTSPPGVAPVFLPQQYYTRNGNFSLNAEGYMVNDTGQYLNGWVTNASGTLNKSNIVPIQISNTAYKPVATANMTLSANLPPAGNPDPTGTLDAAGFVQQLPETSTIDVYDEDGTAHQLTLTFTETSAAEAAQQNGGNAFGPYWTLNVTDDQGNTIAAANLQFAADGTLESVFAGNPFVPGTPPTNANLQNASTPPTFTPGNAGSESSLTLQTNYPTTTANVFQSINLSLGKFGGTDGLTQFAATTYTLNGITQDGVAPGSFSNVTTTSTGDVLVNYTNGQSRTVAQVPITTFPAPDSLQSQNGEAFTSTAAAGNALISEAGANGAGTLVTNSVESSNVDLATEFTSLIVAQQAYSANAKVVTTANQLLQVTLDMKQ